MSNDYGLQRVHSPELLTNEEKGHQQKKIKFILQDRYWFKLYIVFKRDPDFGAKTQQGRHFYGNEHSCTYAQCVSRKIPFIMLDRLKGYNDLVGLVSKGGDFYGKYISAKIYGIDLSVNPTGARPVSHDILHRVYLKNKLQKEQVNDPVIDSDKQFLKLFYTVGEYNRLVIHDTDPAAAAGSNQV